LNNLKNNSFLQKQGNLSVLALFIFIALSVMLFVFQPEPEANINQPIPVVVNTAKLKMEDIAPRVEYTGRLEPSKKAELKFEINGRLAKKLVEPGSKVKAGDTLLILEEYYIFEKLYKLALRNYELQTKEVERMAILDKKSLLSKSQYDKTIQKQIELESFMYRSKQDFQKTFLKAKFSGVINQINIDEGDTVSPNMVIANLIDNSSLDLYVEVRGNVIKGLKLGMNITVSSKEVISEGELIAFQTSPNLETYTHLLRIRIKDEGLRAGMMATAKFILPEINNSFGVPVSSVLNDDGKKFIFIVQNRKLRKIEINLITRFEGIYVISGNIKENDIIVIKDVSSLSEDQNVVISQND
jgi:RND family efflux transporter MFP subunit